MFNTEGLRGTLGNSLNAFSSKLSEVRSKSSPETREPDARSNETSRELTPKRQLKIDLLDGNKGFTLSQEGTEEEIPEAGARDSVNHLRESKSFKESTRDSRQTKESNKESVKEPISRSHWVQPTTTAICSKKNCGVRLNVKNGVVNCRKCGKLFCNKHADYLARLKNSPGGPIYDASAEAVYSRCCEDCYFKKPYFSQDSSPLMVERTEAFKRLRRLARNKQAMSKEKIQRRFIKLVNFEVEQMLKQNNSWLKGNSWLKPLIDSSSMVGKEYWQNDSEVPFCTICFVRFNILIRKHHCRLCGKIVCDDPYGERKSCSIVVPYSKILSLLPNLNFSPQVKANMHRIEQDRLSFRCCVNCKNDLLHEWKAKLAHKSDPDDPFSPFNSMLALKDLISRLLPKYKELVSKDDNQSCERLRPKIMDNLKSYESMSQVFKSTYFMIENDKLLVREKYQDNAKILMNMQQAIVNFLQESLLSYKQQSEILKEKDQSRVDSLANSVQARPRLTKQQIRELREQLMVMNEQKFIVENQLNDFIKKRKFDELGALNENKKELEEIIKGLEEKLGNFGF